jgi:hypothetical protein
LENEIKIVKAITEDINMNFGLKKCARVCLKKKVNFKAKHIQEAHFGKNIKKLDHREAYKYLGIEESHDIEHKKEKKS